MKFNKFLRNNSRTLLMVFMSLLLVTFLIPQTIQSLGARDRTVSGQWGTAFGKKIRATDLDAAYSDASLLARAGLLQRLPESAALDFYLLTEEARRMGVRVSQDEVKQSLTQMGMTDDRLREMQRSSHRGYNEIYDVIGRWLAVQRLSMVQRSALVDSLPRLEKTYRDRNQEAVAQLSIVDDKAFLHLVPEPTEEQLQAFFDECKVRKTAHTEDQLLFGYLLPDRVKLEYLTVDPQKIKGEIPIQAVQVQRFFTENAQNYTKPNPLTTQPDETGQIPTVPLTFEEARDRVRADYREARAIEVAQGLMNDINSDAQQPWVTTSRDPEGFPTAPEGAPASFEDLKQKFSATYQIEYGQTALLSESELLQTTAVGKANVTAGREQIRAAELAMRVKGILTADPNDGKPVLNLMEPALAFTSRLDPSSRKNVPNQAYVFRVIEVAPSAPPESLDPLRTQVVADWKSVQAHELARQQAEALATRARAVGLPAAVADATDLKAILAAADQAASQPAESGTAPPATQYVQDLEPFTPNKITRFAPFLQKIGRVQQIPQAIFDLAKMPVDAATPNRVQSLPLATQFRWVVAQLDEVKPIYAGTFEGQVAKALREDWSRQQQFLNAWNAPNYVKVRTGFVPAAPIAPRPPTPSP